MRQWLQKQLRNLVKKNTMYFLAKEDLKANEVFASLESNFAWTLWELGAAEVNPEDLNIPKP